MINDKVFCNKCKYYVYYHFNEIKETCKHPKNIGYYNDYNKRKKYYAHDPKIINKNNNCEWFKFKWFYFRKKRNFIKDTGSTYIIFKGE